MGNGHLMAARASMSAVTPILPAGTDRDRSPAATTGVDAARERDVLALVIKRQGEILDEIAAGTRLPDTLQRIAGVAEELVPCAAAAIQLFGAAGQPSLH